MNLISRTELSDLSEVHALFAREEWASARCLLEREIQRSPCHAPLHHLLGHCCLNLNDAESASRCYAASVRLAPNDPAAYSCLALALQLKGEAASASAAARRALELDPKATIAMKVMARSALDAGRAVEAAEWAIRILAVDPQDANASALRDQARALEERRMSTGLPADGSDCELRKLLNNLLETVGFRRLQKLGFHLQRNDYYSPLNDCDFLEANLDLWSVPPIEPPNIEWRRADQLALVREISPYVLELSDVPEIPPQDSSAFGWRNNFWENGDALAHYGIVRARRPRRYVEIGCGWSTLLLKRALSLNLSEGADCAVTLIEPYPNPSLFRHFPNNWTIRREMLQRSGLEIFSQLGAGDILFYDGSHCAKVGSDVNWFFFRILPMLQPGVIVHVHDIMLPHEYPREWIFERGQTWNEQYLLQAFLMHNKDYAILLAAHYLAVHHPEELSRLYHGLQSTHGCSFWIQKTNA